MWIRRLTPDEEPDIIDGSTDSYVREYALALIDRDSDDLSDDEHLLACTDDYWFIGFCLDTLKRLPSEVAPIMGSREYTRLRAYYIVKRAYDDLLRAARTPATGGKPSAE